MLARPARPHQTGGAKLLQMLGGVGDAQAGDPGELLDTALPLSEEIQELQTCCGTQGAGDAGEVLEERACLGRRD